MTTAVTVQSEVLNSELISKWLDFSQVKPSSVKSYVKGIKNFAKYCRENKISLPEREDMLNYRRYLEKSYKSASTRNLYLTATKRFFNFLLVEGLIVKNPADAIKGFKVGTMHKKDAVQPEQNSRVIKSIDTSTLKGKRDKAMYLVMSVCALRTVEVSRARIENLVEENGVSWLYVTGKGHDSADAKVKLPAIVVTALREYLLARGKVNKADALFASLSHRNFGKNISTGTISTLVKKLFRQNGMDSARITCHSLRHGAATTAIKAGADIRQVQQFLRHSKIDVTLRYLHDMERAANPCETLIAATLDF